MRFPIQSGALLAAAVLVPGGASLAQGSAGRETGWFTSAELAAVWTGGNAESNTLGLTLGLRRVWSITEFKLDGGVVRTRSSITTRRAVGTAPDDFQLIEESTTETTAERFFARVRADYTIAQSVFWFGGVDWLRNTFAGIDSRTLVAVGVGVSWLDNDRLRFKTDYGFTFTFEDEVVQNPFVRSTFPGSRITYDFQATITATTAFTSELIADWNLDNTKDLRLEVNNALPVTISSHLALKPSVQLSWRNDPAITNVSLIDPSGTPTGQTVLIPLEKLDTFLRVALVIKI